MLSKLSTWKKVLLSIFILGSLVAIAHYITTQPYRQLEKEERAVYQAAQSFVLDILKTPSTAEFQEFNRAEMIVDTDEEKVTYYISAYVDSQNGFGAMLRNDWEVSMNYQGGEMSNSRNWKLRYITFDDETIYAEDF